MNRVMLLSATAVMAILSGAAPVTAKPSHTPATVLRNQNSNFGTGVLSDNSNSQYGSVAADDFVIPSGETWRIAEVDVTGVYYNGSGPASSEVIAFYMNNKKGKPGRVRRGPFTLNCSDNNGSFQCILPKPVSLSSGTWWVSVAANCDFVSCGEWGWIENTVVHGNSAVSKQEGGPWTKLGTDLAFTLTGKP